MHGLHSGKTFPMLKISVILRIWRLTLSSPIKKSICSDNKVRLPPSSEQLFIAVASVSNYSIRSRTRRKSEWYFSNCIWMLNEVRFAVVSAGRKPQAVVPWGWTGYCMFQLWIRSNGFVPTTMNMMFVSATRKGLRNMPTELITVNRFPSEITRSRKISRVAFQGW